MMPARHRRATRRFTLFFFSPRAYDDKMPDVATAMPLLRHAYLYAIFARLMP